MLKPVIVGGNTGCDFDLLSAQWQAFRLVRQLVQCAISQWFAWCSEKALMQKDRANPEQPYLRYSLTASLFCLTLPTANLDRCPPISLIWLPELPLASLFYNQVQRLQPTHRRAWSFSSMTTCSAPIGKDSDAQLSNGLQWSTHPGVDDSSMCRWIVKGQTHRAKKIRAVGIDLLTIAH